MRQAGFPSQGFNPLGFRKAIFRGSLPPFYLDLVQWTKDEATDGIYTDKRGTWPTEYRVGGWYLSVGTIATGLISTTLTYTDAVTLLEVSTTTDASGNFAVPVNGIVDLTIDGHYFPIEESTGSYIGAIDGEYYAVTSPTWVASDAVPSYADENGYTISDSTYMFWDEALTLPIADGINITKGCGWKEDSAVYVTSDDYIYVTSDNYIYVTK